MLVFGLAFQGIGGVVLAVGLTMALVGGISALFVYMDEQENQEQPRTWFGLGGGPDEDRSRANFGAWEAATSLAILGSLVTLVGVTIQFLGDRVDEMEKKS